VAKARTSRQLIRSESRTAPRAVASAWSSARWTPIVVRIAPNMCPPLEEHTSIDRLGRTPASSRRPVAGQPWPICISTSAATDTVPPVAAINAISSSAIVLQCT
jgi:hypothetical protein